MRAWAVASLALALALPGDGPSAPTDVPFAVTVRDGQGRPVPTLAAADFQITENGSRVRVVEAAWIPERAPTRSGGAANRQAPDAVGPGAPDSGVPASSVALPDAEAQAAVREPDTRVIAIFLDEYHVAPSQVPTLRAALSAVLRDEVRPGDLVLTVKPLDPLLSLPLHRGNAEALAAVASFDGRLGDYAARNAFERELIAADPARIDRARTRIALSAMQAMVSRLAGLGARRKALLVVGGALPVSRLVPTRTNDGLPSVDALTRLAARANVSISLLDAGGDPAGAGAAAGGADAILADVVQQTDGRTLTASGPANLRAWLDDLGGYYLLTLEGAGDGRFHPLEVRTIRAGLRVRARAGYWAVSPDEIARLARSSAAPAPPRPLPPPLRTSPLIVPWIGQARTSDGRTRVSFVWEAASSRAGERARVLPPSRVRLRAQTPDGVPVFDGVVQSSSGGLGTLSEARFDVAPGRLRFHMSIEDASARVLDTDVREVVVAPLTDAVSLGTPRVYRTRTAREFGAVRDDPGASPVASRVFSRVERLLLRVPVYAAGAPAAADVDVTAGLLNHRGQVMRSLPVSREPDPAFAVTDIPLAGLAAGNYGVQWRATRSSASVLETVTFRVVP